MCCSGVSVQTAREMCSPLSWLCWTLVPTTNHPPQPTARRKQEKRLFKLKVSWWPDYQSSVCDCWVNTSGPFFFCALVIYWLILSLIAVRKLTGILLYNTAFGEFWDFLCFLKIGCSKTFSLLVKEMSQFVIVKYRRNENLVDNFLEQQSLVLKFPFQKSY